MTEGFVVRFVRRDTNAFWNHVETSHNKLGYLPKSIMKEPIPRENIIRGNLSESRMIADFLPVFSDNPTSRIMRHIPDLGYGALLHGVNPVRALICGLRAAPMARLASETPRCGSVCEAYSRTSTTSPAVSVAALRPRGEPLALLPKLSPTAF